MPEGSEIFEISTVLAGWTQVINPTSERENLSDTLELVTIMYPTGGELRLFGRLNVNP